MGLKEFYYKLEDKYFAMLDHLEEKGINLYKLIDPLEKNGIPTFPIFIILILAIIGLIIFLLLPVFGITGAPQGTAVRFLDETNDPLSEINLKIKLDNQSQTIKTDDDGYYYFKNLKKESAYKLKLVDDKYIFSDREEYTIDTSLESTVVHLKEGAFSTTKTILFKTQSGEAITSALNVEFSCIGTDYEKTVVVNGGSYTLDDIPINCGSLNVDVKDRSGYEINIPASGTSGEVLFSSSVDYATLSVKIKDKDKGIILSNMSVSIYDTAGRLVDTGQTNANGIFTTELVQVSKTYKIIVSDPALIYSGITEQDYINNLQAPVTIATGMNNKEFEIKQDVIGFIKIKVKNNSGTYLEGVTAELSKNGTMVATKITDSTGYVEFGVRENVTFSLILDKEGYYLSPNQKVTISETIKEVTLREMDETSTSSINITVTDNDLNPLEYATVKIWDALNNTLVKTVTTDVSGRVIVSNLNLETTYLAEAIVGPFTGRTNNFVVREREETAVPIIVDIGYGTYNLTILNSEGVTISNATVKAYDASTNNEMTDKQTTTNETGLAILPIRADKEVFFSIITENGNIITKRYSVDAEDVINDTIIIPSTISSSANNIEFVGYYSGSGEQLPAVSAGQSVTARFILNINKKYSKVIAHIRTGEGETCDNKVHSITEDSIYIKQVKYAGNKMIGSTQYTPCNGESRDTASIVRKDAKWFNLVLNNPVEGSYIIDTDIVVTDSAISNQSLFYRAEFQQSSSILRYPKDEVLGSSISSSDKQALYAYANKRVIPVGDTAGCDNGVCYAFTIKDKSSGLEKRIMDKFTAKDGTDYQLNFRLSFERSAIDAALVVFPTGQTINLNSYNITPAGSLPISDTDFSNISLGSISENGTVNGYIDLSVINDVTDELTFTILSNSDTILSKTILFDLKPSKKMVVDIIPKTIVPFVPNTIFVGATDEADAVISDATILVRINGKPITDGRTNKEGIFSFILPSPDISDVVEITVKKQNYSTTTTKLIVSEELITSIPETLEIQLDLSKGYSQEADLILSNNSMLPLTIIGVETNIKSEYVSLKSNAQGIVLEPSFQQGITISAKLTEKGIDLMTQKVFNGDLLVSVSEASLAKVWIIKIPINVRITFGNALDNTECLEIDPEETTIRVENTNDIEYNLKIKNNCTISEEPVDVGRIYVEADYKNTKKLGDYYVVVSGQEKKLALDEKIEVLNKIASEGTATVKLLFRPNKSAKSGLSNPIITFSSNRPNTNGIDVIEVTHLPQIILNNYITCIETPSSPITIPYCMSYGYSMYAGGTNTLNFNPFLMGGYQYQYSGYAPQTMNQSWISGTTYPSGMLGYQSVYGSIPTTNYSESTPAGYSNSGYGSSGLFGCEKASIQVKNNCSEEIALQFSTLGGVTITDPENSEMILKKGASGMLGAQGSQVLGQYKIAVNAKPNDDTVEEYTYVKDITVTVNRPVSILPENCISVVPTEFDFSGIDTTEKKLMVINACYDMGYALIGLNVLNQDQLEIGGVQYFSIGDVNANLNPKKTYRYTDGKTTEIMTIKVRRNPEITEKTLRIDSDEGNSSIAGKLTNIRKDYYDLGKAINLTALLGITYSNPRLSKDEMEVELTLTDKLQWLSYIDSFADTSSALEGQTQADTSGTTTPGTPGASSTSFTEYFSGSDVLNPGECYDPKGFRKQGLTGEENFKKFGFNRLLFTYNETDITYNICDYGRIYCDQDQLRISMSKKADLYKSNKTVLLDGVYFLQDGTKIAANPYLENGENPIDQTTIETIMSNTSFNNLGSNEIAQKLKSVLDNVPAELRKFTIIEVMISAEPNTLSNTDITKYINLVSDNNIHKSMDVYQMTVDSFLRSEGNLNAIINNPATSAEEQAKIAEFLYQYLNTMQLYYGDTISPFIINAKTYGPLNSGTTKAVFGATQFMSGAWAVNLDTTSPVTEIATPGTYNITLKTIGDNKQLTYAAQKINSKVLDYYNNNTDYKTNIFFTNPTNAYYHNYAGIVFKNTFSGITKATSVFTNYTAGFDKIQDGIILNIPTNQTNMSFKDIRPLQILATGPYKAEYLVNGKYSSKDVSETKNTIFIFQKINDTTKGIDYQLKTSSNQEIKFNISPSILSSTKNYTHIYGVLKDTSSSSSFTKEETSSVKAMVDGISSQTMCFNFNNGFMLWYNPSKLISTTDSNLLGATGSSGSQINIINTTGNVYLNINGGNTTNQISNKSNTHKITDGTIILDLTNKKLSGFISFSEPGSEIISNISLDNGTAVISNNTITLTINGKVRTDQTFSSISQITINTNNVSNINGTYAIVPSNNINIYNKIMTFN